ncbi:MAG: hypothetical protein JO119_13995 [Acidobacteria bacterium]|nr:hypothetical protein [Acidobacteriota bacterium]
MKIIGHRVPSLLYVAAMLGIYAVAPTVFGQAPKSKYDGSYHGTYSGSFAGDSVNGSVVFSVANGSITVTDPGQGKGTVDSSGSATFSGSLGVANVTCTFTGSFRPSTDAKQGVRASGSWSCVGSGQTGNGAWSADRR